MNKNLFHVHTKRCLHASDEEDEEYIKRAIELGTTSITFTDHAPFPGDPFGNRMLYKELDGYVKSLEKLRDKYADQIEVKIGLEIEYLPSYIECYKELKESGEFDILMLGQHFYEVKPDKYSFSFNLLEAKKREFEGCGRAIVDGINTGLFDVVAHPDRIFKRRKKWTPEMERVAKDIIEAAKKQGVRLEQNESSRNQEGLYWEEFWRLVPDEMTIKGLDAHSVGELKIL